MEQATNEQKLHEQSYMEQALIVLCCTKLCQINFGVCVVLDTISASLSFRRIFLFRTKLCQMNFGFPVEKGLIKWVFKL